jgi:hypothetical protein
MGWKLLTGLFLAGACFAQQWEVGGFIGYGWYRDGTIFGPGESIQAGIRNRFAAGAVVGEDLYEHVSGEVRWMYHDGHPFLSGPGVNTDIQGNSHTFTYDMLFHVYPPEHRLRPFVAVGIGAKDYIIAGPEPNPQPIPAVASLIAQDQWKLVVDVGFGVKYLLRPHVLVRADFRDYMTSFPRAQLVPAAGNTARGIFQQFTPMFGVSYWF